MKQCSTVSRKTTEDASLSMLDSERLRGDRTYSSESIYAPEDQFHAAFPVNSTVNDAKMARTGKCSSTQKCSSGDYETPHSPREGSSRGSCMGVCPSCIREVGLGRDKLMY